MLDGELLTMSRLKKGDMIGINIDNHLYTYVIAQIIREERFFYCYCRTKKYFTLIVFDPARHFIICPGFNPNIEPDIDFLQAYNELATALDRLFYDEPSDWE